MNNYYIMESSYFNLMMEKSRQDTNMNRFLDACLMLDESANVDVMALNEGLGDSIKSGWDKFVAFIKKLIANFIESMTKLFASDKTWLEKYKNIIVGKKPGDFKITDWPEYDVGIQRITQCTIPQLQYQSMEKLLANRDDLLKNICPSIGSNFSTFFPEGTETKMTDGLKMYFTGGNNVKEIQMNQLNFTDLYNFCYQNDKLISYVNKDEKAIEAGSKEAQNVITKAIKDIDEETKNKAVQNTEVPKTNGGGQTEEQKNQDNATDNDKPSEADIAAAKKEAQKAVTTISNMNAMINDPKNANNKEQIDACTRAKKTAEDKLKAANEILKKADQTEITASEMSFVYKGNIDLYNIINELNISKDSSGKTPAQAGKVANTNDSLDRVSSGNTGQSSASEESNKAAGKNTLANSKDSAEAIKKVENNIATYNSVCQSILSAKSSAITEIYKAYMDVLRAHVKSIVGKEDEVNSINARSATDYSNSVYNDARMRDMQTAHDNYEKNKSDQTLADFVNICKKIYGQSQWNTRLSASGNDEVKTAYHFFEEFKKGYDRAHPAGTGQNDNQQTT